MNSAPWQDKVMMILNSITAIMIKYAILPLPQQKQLFLPSRNKYDPIPLPTLTPPVCPISCQSSSCFIPNQYTQSNASKPSSDNSRVSLSAGQSACPISHSGRQVVAQVGLPNMISAKTGATREYTSGGKLCSGTGDQGHVPQGVRWRLRGVWHRRRDIARGRLLVLGTVFRVSWVRGFHLSRSNITPSMDPRLTIRTATTHGTAIFESGQWGGIPK